MCCLCGPVIPERLASGSNKWFAGLATQNRKRGWRRKSPHHKLLLVVWTDTPPVFFNTRVCEASYRDAVQMVPLPGERGLL